MYRSLFLIFACLSILSSCSREIQDPCTNKKPSDQLTQMDIGLVCFETVDSYDLNYTNKNKIIINGNIFTPNVQQDSYNAVIMTHGSGGQRRYHNKYIELLTDMGLVVFQLDHYSARKIKYDKKFSKVSGLTFMNDAYAALKLIKTNPVINNVGYLGWSQGGVGPILSHFKFVNDILPFDERFHASIALYPYCGFTFPNNAETETPLLMITGSDDDLTPEAACRNIYSKFFRNDKKIKFISMENARHGFDNPFLYFGFTFDKLPNLKIINKECTLTINKNGEINNMEGILINSPEMSEYFLNKCSFKGVTVKYNSQATKKTLNEVKQFFNENLINK